MPGISYRFKILLFFISFSPSLVFGQLEKANKQYEKQNYIEALGYYQNSWAKNSKNEYVASQIGNCYMELGDYLIASEYYKKAFVINPKNNSTKLAYANALIRSMEIDHAEEFLIEYLVQNPYDEQAKGMLKTVESIKEWQEEKLEEYIIIQLDNINSKFDDYAPFVKDSNLIFTSNRMEDLKDFAGVSNYKERHTNLFQAEFEYKDNEIIFNKINLLFKFLDARNNIGPISFTGDYNACYFNSTNYGDKQSSDSSLTMKTYFMEYSDGNWSDPKSINLNSEKYSIHHPFITPDGKTLFFASDMPGGQGGIDLYYSLKNDGNLWGNPINLGPLVNSVANEAFPTFNDSILYFSSNGQVGYGKYDIYKIDNYKSPGEIINMGYPLNSSSDDLYIFFNSHNEGFFTSNRKGGQGGDDIFAFISQPVNFETTSIRGKVEFNNFPSGNTRVDLVDGNNNILQTIITNEDGEFIFSGLGVHTKYAFYINYDDKPDSLNARFYMLNGEGEKVLILLQSIDGEYGFETLPPDEFEALPIIVESSSLLTINLKGNIYQDMQGDIKKHVSIYILNDEKKVIAKGYTDENGNFSFSELPPQDHYTLMVTDSIPGVKIVILNKGDRVVELKYNSNDKGYYYERLSAEEDFITLKNESGEEVKIKLSENFEVDNIYYAYNSWEINQEAAESLNRLIKLMNMNSHISITLYSHTDSRGKDKYNLTLSQKRAESAKDYLVKNGISSDRIKAVGMGEKELTNKCKDRVECSEEEHAQNRRTEFEISRND
jgi:outer membrane protein OmpA-like peptidoglycan-associated protein/tetratricopeptide (TPR) repeat protein